MKIDNSPARGTRDLLPATVARRDHVLAAIVEVYHRFGYRRIETPALENLDRLTSGQGGENEKLLFKIMRRGLGEQVEPGTRTAELADLALRYDLTVPLTRFYGANHATLPSPFRSLQYGPVWRAERPQKGRYRQFVQCDIDMIGEESVLAESELIEATMQALTAVGLTGATVRVSDRRFVAALAQAAGLDEASWPTFFIGLDKLDKIGWDGVRADLEGKGLPGEKVGDALERIQKLRELPATSIADALADAVPTLEEQVIADLAATTAGLAEAVGVNWEFDPTLVRGMGYYTGQIFEVAHPGSNSSIAGGGRYDKLIGRSLGKDVPACGFSIGFERIVDLLGDAPAKDSVAVLFEKEVPAAQAMSVARELRKDGRTATVLGRRGKFGAQLGRMEEWGFTSFVHLKGDRDLAAPLEEKPLGAK